MASKKSRARRTGRSGERPTENAILSPVDKYPDAIKHVRLSTATFHTVWLAYWMFARHLGRFESKNDYIVWTIKQLNIRRVVAGHLRLGVCMKKFFGRGAFHPDDAAKYARVASSLLLLHDDDVGPDTVRVVSKLPLPEVKRLGDAYFNLNDSTEYPMLVEDFLIDMDKELLRDNPELDDRDRQVIQSHTAWRQGGSGDRQA